MFIILEISGKVTEIVWISQPPTSASPTWHTFPAAEKQWPLIRHQSQRLSWKGLWLWDDKHIEKDKRVQSIVSFPPANVCDGHTECRAPEGNSCFLAKALINRKHSWCLKKKTKRKSNEVPKRTEMAADLTLSQIPVWPRKLQIRMIVLGQDFTRGLLENTAPRKTALPTHSQFSTYISLLNPSNCGVQQHRHCFVITPWDLVIRLGAGAWNL